MASVSGAHFSFPTKTLWASIGAHTGSFPLPLATDYTISFGAFVLMHPDSSEDELVEAESHRVEKISGSEVPADRRSYSLTLRKIPNVYSGDADLVVVYSVQ
jgi:hypothetical protein